MFTKLSIVAVLLGSFLGASARLYGTPNFTVGQVVLNAFGGFVVSLILLGGVYGVVRLVLSLRN